MKLICILVLLTLPILGPSTTYNYSTKSDILLYKEDLITAASKIKELEAHIQELEADFNTAVVLRDNFVNVTDTRPEIKEALQCYTGPDFIITSMKRNYNRKSKHYRGLAFDVRYDTDVIKWLHTEEGITWLENNHMRFLIEHTVRNRSYYKDKKRYKNVMYNAFATGKHIHIEYNGDIKKKSGISV